MSIITLRNIYENSGESSLVNRRNEAIYFCFSFEEGYIPKEELNNF